MPLPVLSPASLQIYCSNASLANYIIKILVYFNFVVILYECTNYFSVNTQPARPFDGTAVRVYQSISSSQDGET